MHLDNVELSTRSQSRIYRPWKSLGFYTSGETEIEELLDGSLFRSDLAQISPLLSSFSRFWASAIEIELLNEEEEEWRGILSPKLVVVLKPPTTHLPCILQRFWLTPSHLRLYSSQMQNSVVPEMTSRPNSYHSPLFLGRELGKGQFSFTTCTYP